MYHGSHKKKLGKGAGVKIQTFPGTKPLSHHEIQTFPGISRLLKNLPKSWKVSIHFQTRGNPVTDHYVPILEFCGVHCPPKSKHTNRHGIRDNLISKLKIRVIEWVKIVD